MEVFEQLASGNARGAFPLSRIVCHMDWAAEGRSHIDAHGHLHEEDKTGPEGLLKLSAAQIETAKITVAKVGPGMIFRQLTVPGTVVADADRLAHVAAKVAGTIGELRKRLGDNVDEGELIGAIDSSRQSPIHSTAPRNSDTNDQLSRSSTIGG